MTASLQAAGPSLVQDAWSRALRALDVDLESPTSSAKTIEISRDQANVRTFLLTHNPHALDSPSTSGQQARDSVTRLRSSVSAGEFLTCVIEAITERIDHQQHDKLRCLERGEDDVPGLLNALVVDLKSTQEMLISLLDSSDAV